MPKVRFNIKTNLRGTEYGPGDEATLSEADVKRFEKGQRGGIPHVVRLKKGTKDAKTETNTSGGA